MAHKEAHCASIIVSNSHHFHSKPIELPIPKIWLLKIWPWKYKVKVRGEVKVLSHNLGSNILSDSVGNYHRSVSPRSTTLEKDWNFLLIFLQFNVDDLRFKPWGPTIFDWVSNTASYGFISLYVNPPSYSYDRAFFLNLTFKIQSQSHSWRSHNRNNILSTHIPLVPCQWALPFPRCSIFKIWPWKSKVKVIAQGHKVGITPYRLTSLMLHVDWPCHSWDTAISKFDVENSRSRSWVRSKLKVITWVLH